MESGPGYGGQLAPIRVLIGILWRGGIGRILRLGVGLRRGSTGTPPTDTCGDHRVGDGGLTVRTPHLEILVFGNLQGEPFCQHDYGARRCKMLRSPELVGASALSTKWTSYSSVSPVARERTGRCFSFRSL